MRLTYGSVARVLAVAAVALAVLAAAGCSWLGPALGVGVEGIDWVLQGSSASAVDFRAFNVTARFEAGTVNGFSGVNAYSGKYRLDADGSIAVSSLQVTLVAGTPEAMRAEETYLTLLRAVRTYDLVQGRLELRDADGNPLLVYREKETTQAQPEPAPEATVTVPTSTAPSGPRVSDTSIAYARSIGGTSHQGELLYFIVGGTYANEAEASAALNEALPRFGDMQSYFIVQLSDDLSGLGQGRWVVVEAYRARPDENNLALAKRAFPQAAVKRATVVTADPIPVYEDLVD